MPEVTAMTKADMAMDYVVRGWAVHPLVPLGKRPATQHGFKDATTDPKTIIQWWQQNPDYNIGIATGKASGLVVFDIDVKNGQPGLETYQQLLQHHDLNTLKCHTPSGGIHLYFLYTGDDLGNRTGILPGLDIRAEGGYVVAPGSTTPEGEYRWD